MLACLKLVFLHSLSAAQSLQTLADNTAGGSTASSYYGVSTSDFVAVVLGRPNDPSFTSANYTWGSAKLAFTKTNTGEFTWLADSKAWGFQVDSDVYACQIYGLVHLASSGCNHVQGPIETSISACMA